MLNHFCFKSDQTDFVEELLVGGSVHDDRARKLLDEIWNKKTWLLTANTVKRIVAKIQGQSAVCTHETIGTLQMIKKSHFNEDFMEKNPLPEWDLNP